MKGLRQVVLFSLTLKKIAVALSAFVLLSNLSPISPFDAPEANALSLQTGVTDVAAGLFHSCAVVSGGLQCWGANGQGQLGDNTKTARLTPISTFQPNSGVTAVSTGQSHTCAVVSGGVKCWGLNNAGQLGDGTTTQRLLPVDAIPANSGATAISAGVSSTCAVVSGGVQCWGNMANGVIGNGDFNGQVKTPYQTLPAGSGATSVSVGRSTACAIVSNSLWCWGDNSTGMYGNGTTNGSASGVYPLSVSFTDPGLTAVSVGQSHVCAVISGGVQCWGLNNAGQLGDGTTNDSIDRVTAIAANSGATSVTASNSNTCAAVAGGVKCWGQNDQNQLGNGDTSTQSSPVEIIPASSGVTLVKSFWWHTCAIVASAVKCWGYNNAGQTGDSRKINNSTPFTVTSLTVKALYGVTFDAKGGSAIDSASFISRGSVSAPTSPKRAGYNFLGWSATDGGSAVSFPYSPGVSSDVTLYAIWGQVSSYTVTFNSKSGSSVASGSFVTDGSLTAPTPPTRAGYTFMGWSATDGGSAVSFPYSPGVSQDITLFARWSADSHTVTFNSKSGSSVASGSFVTGGSITAPSSPIRTGYTLLGWSATDGGSAVSFPYSPAGTTDVTLYALWSADLHAAYFSSNGALYTYVFFVTDGSIEKPADPVRTGYTFLGWWNHAVGNVSFPYSPGPSDDIGFNALWSADSHSVTFNSNGGSSVASGSFVTGGSLTIPYDPTRAGYTFMGWSSSNGAVVFPYSPAETTDITLNALWSADSHSVTFNSNGGSSVASGSFVTGGSITAPSSPTRTGYTFLGWSATDGGSAMSFPYSPGAAEDITLYALWSADLHAAFFYLLLNGDLYSYDGNLHSYVFFVTDGSIEKPADPVRTGYTFLGWWNHAVGNVSFPYSPGPSDDINFMALWSADSHSVTFNSNGGSSVASGSFVTDGSLSAPSAPTRAGYSFMGWSATDGGSAVSFPYSPGVSQDITLFARWSADSHAVTFNSKGGSSVVVGSFVTDGSVSAASAPTRAGYGFLGWSATDGGSSVAFPYSPRVISDITLYALWSADTHTVTFNSMRGNNIAPGSFVTDGYVNAPAAPIRAGYSFAGWSLTDGGSAVSFPYSPSVIGDITLYAKWSFIYKVTFNTKGGSAIAASSFVNGGTVTAPISPIRTGYTFAGWSATDGGSAVSFPYSPGVSAAVTLYSLWSANSNTVTFNSKGGSVVSVGSFTTGGSVDSPSTPSRAGYTFAGWSATDGGSAVSFPYSPGVAQDIKLYARWTATTYALNFNSTGGSSVNAGYFITGGMVTAPAAPSRSGYMFTGWSTSEAGSLVAFPYRPTVTQDQTLYAKWVALVPKLTATTSDSTIGGATIPVQVTGLTQGNYGYLQWDGPTNVSPVLVVPGTNGSTPVVNFATPAVAGTYTLFINVWTGWDSPAINLSKTIVIGKTVSISAKVTSTNPSAKKASLTISGATKFGTGYVASKTLSVSLMRDGNEVAVYEVSTDSKGLFSLTIPGSYFRDGYPAADYTARISFQADSQYRSAAATTAKVTLR